MNGEERKRGTVLVIDDEPGTHAFLEKTLGPRGIGVIAAMDPEEGITKAREIKPDLIFVSLLFPESNGLKVSKTIHSEDELKGIPIVMLISYAGELDPKYTTTIGVVDVIVKPLAQKEIIDRTVDILGKEAVAGPSSEADAVWDIWEKEMDAFQSEDETEGEVSVEKDCAEEALSPEPLFPGSASASHQGISGEEDSPAPEEPAFGHEEESLPERPDFPETDGRQRQAEDDTTAFLRESESLGDKDEEGMPLDRTGESVFESNSSKRRAARKKAVVAAASVVLVSGLALAGYQLLSSGLMDSRISRSEVSSELKPMAIGVKTGSEIPADRSGAAEPSVTVAGEADSPAAVTEPDNDEKPLGRAEQGSASRSLPAAREETKTLNEGLKGPKDNGTQKEAIYSVQVGAFKSEGNAMSLANRMKKKGYEALIFLAPGEDLHRVLLGRFGSREKASELAAKVAREEGMKSVIYRH